MLVKPWYEYYVDQILKMVTQEMTDSVANDGDISKSEYVTLDQKFNMVQYLSILAPEESLLTIFDSFPTFYKHLSQRNVDYVLQDRSRS